MENVVDRSLAPTLFGTGHGRTFMLIEAATVFLALIGTTLSCMNTGARVTYAMGKDKEMPNSLGVLHEGNLTPHRAIWTLAIISAIVGCITVAVYFRIRKWKPIPFSTIASVASRKSARSLIILA